MVNDSVLNVFSLKYRDLIPDWLSWSTISLFYPFYIYIMYIHEGNLNGEKYEEKTQKKDAFI